MELRVRGRLEDGEAIYVMCVSELVLEGGLRGDRVTYGAFVWPWTGRMHVL